MRSCAYKRLGEQQRILNLQLEGFSLPPLVVQERQSGSLEKSDALTSKNQDAVGVSREPGRGCSVKEPPASSNGESQSMGDGELGIEDWLVTR